ncbi:MAG: AAA-like domain-containing protein [Planctomycetota bacterium]|nr:AAA-like domain-containing protein [Planctomycetota bacterium]MDA1137853.1 AAA-like domain-containing protein [Planctomycetota bacterium]
MKRRFNTTGPCNLKEHYMLPAQARLTELKDLIEEGSYFVIHAARQTGKTTLIKDLVRELNGGGDYHGIFCNLETAEILRNPEEGIPSIVGLVQEAAEVYLGVSHSHENKDYANALRTCLATLCSKLDRPLVIMFDEVDCLSDDTLISFLRQLRSGYLDRDALPFAHSLALVGVHNIRDYKAHYRDDRETLQTASPFNIVTEALTLRSFTRNEVSELCTQHTLDTGQDFTDEIVNSIFQNAGGQPWLVNAIAREVVEKILEKDFQAKIEIGHISQAVQNLILRRDTHIDSLLEKLKEERVRRVVEPVLTGEEETFDPMDDDVMYVLDLGLLRRDNGSLVPANPIYAEVIARTLNLGTQYSMMQKDGPTSTANYQTEEDLDVSRILIDFQSFWRQHSEIWQERYEYKEAAPHLILMAFLQNVLNGDGHIIREYGSGRGRVDICMVHEDRHYPIELKVRRSEQADEEGKKQLKRYMDSMGCDVGWLVIFDRRPGSTWDEKIFHHPVEHESKTIHVFGC